MTKNIKYDCVFSMGEICFCANYLKALYLRKFSAPFDWIAGASFEERMNFLLNGFENFFNKEDLIYHGKREFPEPCNIYYNTRTHIVFNHDFPLNKTFEEAYPQVVERYNRRITRLYNLLNKAKSALIVYMEKADTSLEVPSNERLCFLMEKLNQKFKKTHIDLIYVRHNENMKSKEFDMRRVNDYVVVAQCFDRSTGESGTAVGDFNNVKQIFKNIRCKDNLFHSWAYIIYYWIKKVYKTLYRHKIKNGEEYIRLFGIKIYRRKIEE